MGKYQTVIFGWLRSVAKKEWYLGGLRRRDCMQTRNNWQESKCSVSYQKTIYEATNHILITVWYHRTPPRSCSSTRRCASTRWCTSAPRSWCSTSRTAGTSPAGPPTSATTTLTTAILWPSGDTISNHKLTLEGWWMIFRYDLSLTRHYFLIFFSIPAGLWIISCSCLVTSNKVSKSLYLHHCLVNMIIRVEHFYFLVGRNKEQMIDFVFCLSETWRILNSPLKQTYLAEPNIYLQFLLFTLMAAVWNMEFIVSFKIEF